VLVIAGARADVPDGSSYRPPSGFSNGLANGGDRIALYFEDGTVIDALSYGSDGTYDRPPLPAPEAAKSLVRRFADDGTFASAEVSSSPSPGVLEVVASAVRTPPGVSGPPTIEAVEGRFDPRAWAALGVIGVGALLAAAVQRYRVVKDRW
jgi:hypothetical protein